MKTFKSIIKFSAVVVAAITMSGIMTSCIELGDLLFDDPCYDSYRVVEYRHVPVYHDYGYRNSYVPDGTIISSRR